MEGVVTKWRVGYRWVVTEWSVGYGGVVTEWRIGYGGGSNRVKEEWRRVEGGDWG